MFSAMDDPTRLILRKKKSILRHVTHQRQDKVKLVARQFHFSKIQLFLQYIAGIKSTQLFREIILYSHASTRYEKNYLVALIDEAHTFTLKNSSVKLPLVKNYLIHTITIKNLSRKFSTNVINALLTKLFFSMEKDHHDTYSQKKTYEILL